MRLTIDRSGIVKSTLLTATRPPNRRVTCVGDEDRLVVEDVPLIAVPSSVVPRPSSARPAPGSVIVRVELALAPTVGEEALRSQQHHRHQRQAVEQELELDEVDVLEDRDARCASKNWLSVLRSTLLIV